MAINEVTSIDVKTLPPFKRLIMTLGELPTSYLESMSYAELLMWFCNFLQEKVLPTIDNNAEALQDVITYLENLDFQDEVNNKLDEMAEDGTLMQLLAEYLPYVTPEMYGAKGDGVTDDLNAFNTMLESNKNITLINGKTYLLSSYINISNKDNIVINGNNATIKMIDGTVEDELTSEPSLLTLDTCNNITIKDVNLDVNGEFIFRPHIDWGGETNDERTEWMYKRVRTYGGLRLSNCNNAVIDNVKVQKSRTGFLFYYSNNVNLTNSISYKTFADGIFICGNSNYINVENHYCELCGDDCYSTAGFEEGQPKYINFTNCNANNCGGGLICANSSLYTNYYNVNGKEIGYNPYKIESKYAVCDHITLENCNATTVNIPELEEEYAFVLGKRPGSEYNTTNVLIKNSSFIYPGTSYRRIELRHQGIVGIKYVNCTYSGITPVFYSGSNNIELDANNFTIQDAMTFESINPLKIKNNIILNKNNFEVRGLNGLTLNSCSNVLIDNNKITNETTSTSYSIKALTSLANIHTDDFNMTGYYGNVSGLTSDIPVSNSYYFPSCADGQVAISNNIIGTIVSGAFTDYATTTLTGNGLTCTLVRKGKVVTANITGRNTNAISASTADYMFTVPAAYRPSYIVNEVELTGTGKRYLLGLQLDGRFGVQWAYEEIAANSQIFSIVSWIV